MIVVLVETLIGGVALGLGILMSVVDMKTRGDISWQAKWMFVCAAIELSAAAIMAFYL